MSWWREEGLGCPGKRWRRVSERAGGERRVWSAQVRDGGGE